MTTPTPAASGPDPLCAFCGGEVPGLGAIIYHGVVYHPACVEPTLRRTMPSPRPGVMRGA